MNQQIITFDLDKIEGGKIVVRAGHENEKLVTLDEQERELNSDDIVISDGVKAVALGGVMGGQNSEITENTKNILLEVANFNSQNVRKNFKKIDII